jgi:hypothetical protein
MSISRKPRAATAQAVDVDALINRGGTPSAEQNGKPHDKTVAVVLRLPAEMLGQIDASVNARPIRTPRHTWLLEAVHEKLKLEQRT